MFNELMNLGIVSFCLFMAEISIDMRIDILYHFEIAHLLIFGFGLMYAGHAAIVLLLQDQGAAELDMVQTKAITDTALLGHIDTDSRYLLASAMSVVIVESCGVAFARNSLSRHTAPHAN